MPAKWPKTSALTGWLGFSGSRHAGDPQRVEPLLTRPRPPSDPSLALLERFATPGEFLGERDAALSSGNAERVALLDASVAGQELAACSDPQPFRRSDVLRGATLYQGSGERRQLLIGFGGRGDLIGPPMPVFLQCIDATRWDVLILRDAENSHFRKGVKGIGQNFTAVTRWLAKQAENYAHVTCLGYHAGGLPAVWAGISLGVDRVVCVSGFDPDDAKQLVGGKVPPAAFDPACACIDSSVSRPFAFFAAATHKKDIAFGRRLASQTGGRAAGAVGHSGRSLLGYLRQRGQLGPFLDFALTTQVDATLQARLTGVLRTARAGSGTSGADQIPAVAEGVAPDGD